MSVPGSWPRRAAVFLLGCVVMAVVVIGLSTLTKVSDVQDTNTAKNQQRDQQLAIIKKIARQVESCTTPGEPCSNRGQRQTAKIVAVLDVGGKRNAAAAASCATQIPNPTYPRVYRCMIFTLNHAGGRAP